MEVVLQFDCIPIVLVHHRWGFGCDVVQRYGELDLWVKHFLKYFDNESIINEEKNQMITSTAARRPSPPRIQIRFRFSTFGFEIYHPSIYKSYKLHNNIRRIVLSLN